MKNFLKKIPQSFQTGLLFGFGILCAGIVLAQVDLNFGDSNDIPINKEAGDEVTNIEFNALVNDLRTIQNALSTGCEEGYVLQGLDANGETVCVSAGVEGGGDIPVPTNISATIEEQEDDTVTVNLTWDNDGLGNYDVTHVGGSLVAGGGAIDGEIRSTALNALSWPALSPGLHSFRVRGKQVGENGAWSEAITVMAANMLTTPGVPEGLGIGNFDGETIPLSWSAPTSDGGSSITGYEVYMRMENQNASVATTLHAESTQFSGAGPVVRAEDIDTRVLPAGAGRSLIITDNGYAITDNMSSVFTANNTVVTDENVNENIDLFRENLGDFSVVSNATFRNEYIVADQRFNDGDVSLVASVGQDGQTFISLTAHVAVSADTLTFDWPNIIRGRNYYFKVRALNERGVGAFTEEVGVSIAPNVEADANLQTFSSMVGEQFVPDADEDGIPNLLEQTVDWLDRVPCYVDVVPDWDCPSPEDDNNGEPIFDDGGEDLHP